MMYGTIKGLNREIDTLKEEGDRFSKEVFSLKSQLKDLEEDNYDFKRRFD